MHRSHRHSFKLIPLAFIAIMVLGLIFMGGQSRSQSAWMEGYMMGQLSAGKDGGDAIPYYGHRGFMGGGSHRLGGLIPMLLCGGFLHFGPRPPWCWDEDDQDDQEPEEKEEPAEPR